LHVHNLMRRYAVFDSKFQIGHVEDFPEWIDHLGHWSVASSFREEKEAFLTRRLCRHAVGCAHLNIPTHEHGHEHDHSHGHGHEHGHDHGKHKREMIQITHSWSAEVPTTYWEHHHMSCVIVPYTKEIAPKGVFTRLGLVAIALLWSPAGSEALWAVIALKLLGLRRQPCTINSDAHCEACLAFDRVVKRPFRDCSPMLGPCIHQIVTD
jgi:hypothetical protein